MLLSSLREEPSKETVLTVGSNCKILNILNGDKCIILNRKVGKRWLGDGIFSVKNLIG